VISFAVDADGGLTDRRLFVRLFAADPESGAGAYPDGIEFGPDGNLYIGQYSSGRILAIAPDASLAGVIEVPSAAAPNLAFAPDGRIMVTAVDDTANPPYAGKVYAVTPP
jgi:sugar lactone lactonase YvrE